MPSGAFNKAFESIQVHEFSAKSNRWEPPVEDACQRRLCMEFKEDLSIGTWNATALFCLDPDMARKRLRFVMELAEKVDVLVVVEAHGQEGCQHTHSQAS